jgi:hypothetical protein
VLVSRNTCASKKSELFPMSRTATRHDWGNRWDSGEAGSCGRSTAGPSTRGADIGASGGSGSISSCLPCGVSEVGPGLLTSGDYRSDMIPASRCGCCM